MGGPGSHIWTINMDHQVDRLIERVNALQKVVDGLTKKVDQLMNAKAAAEEVGS